jgi:hypothetical protein
MALALLHPEPASSGLGFRFDIGKNRYYRYVVGRGRRRRPDGLETIEEPSFESALQGPLPDECMGRGSLTVEALDRERKDRLVQLWSFRSPDGVGPAVSSIQDLGLAGDTSLPSLTLSRGSVMPATARALDTVPFRYREVKYSNAMFLDALGGLLNGILPKIGPIIGSLFSGGGPGGGGGAATGSAAPATGGAGGAVAELIKAVSNPETVKQVLELIKQVQGAGAAGGQSQGKSLALARALDRGPLPRCSDPYSRAQFEPMTILTGITALAPLLEKVVTPDTIKAILGAPTQHIGALMNGLLDFGKLGVQDAEKFREHLRALNPGVNDPGFNQLIATVTQGLSVSPRPLNYARVDSVRLQFVSAPPVQLLGRERLVYKHGSVLAFPLVVDTPQVIRQGVLQLEVKDAKSLAVHHQSRYRVEQVSSGPMLTTPQVSEEESQRLPANGDYLVCATLVWKNKEGQSRGTSMQQEITLMSELTFDRIEESSELIPLKDPERFRDYWHRVWEGAFDDGIKKVELDARYYFVLAPARHNHARIETLANLTAEEPRLSGRLKSGMELSPAGLNRLLSELDPAATALDEVELAALSAPGFAERFQQSARYHVQMRGRRGDRGALWTYPEFKVQHVTLQQAAQTDPHGQVLQLAPHDVRFPVPALLHFVGVRSE